MGCHTWFWRPITEQEYNWMKEYAVVAAESLFKEDNKYDLELLKRSVETGKACYYDMTWYEAGFGVENPKFIESFGTEPYVRYIKNRGKTGKEALYVDVSFDYDFLDTKYHMTMEEMNESKLLEREDCPYFHDVFRVYNYPNVVVHNKMELRKFLKKDYFKLTEWQHKRLSMFFKMYPGGIITFG